MGIRRKWNCGRRLGTGELGATVTVMACCRVATALAEMEHTVDNLHLKGVKREIAPHPCARLETADF